MNNFAFKIAFAFIGGVWIANLAAWPVMAIYLLGVVLLLAALILLRWRPRYALWLTVALFFVCGVVRIIHADQISPSDISRLAGQAVSVEGFVKERPQIIPGDDGQVKVRYIVDTTSIAGATKMSVSGAMILTVRQSNSKAIASYGQQIRVRGTVLALHGYNNPGAVDMVAALKRQGITARMAVDENKLILEPIYNQSLLGKLADWRDSVEATIRSVLPAEQSALLIGLVFGGYQSIPREIVQQFTLTGIVHILSVSGTHIALIAGVVLWTLKRLNLRYRWSAAIAAMSVLVYAIIAGLTPPVVRSALMGIAILLAVGVGREKDASTALAWSALAMLVYQPGLIYDISFQLSFSATAGLIFLYPTIVKRLTVLPGSLATGLAVTLAAQIGAIPFLAWYFNTMSLTSFIANLVVVPLIEIVVVVGLAASLLTTIIPLLAKVMLIVCGTMLSLSTTITAWLAAIPGGTVYLPACNIAAGFIYYFIVAWFFGYLSAWLPSPKECWHRWPMYFASSIVIIGTVGTLYITYPSPVAVHFIDVGQGDAALITTPHGRAIMVDTGGTTLGSNFDIGERVVVPYLRHYGVLALDYLILTHSHQDHAGGAGALVSAIPVKTIITTREQMTPAIRSLVYHKQDGTIIPAYAGQSILLDGVTVEIVHAPLAATRAGNEVSAVIRVSFGNHSFLLTGDLEAKQEANLIGTGQLDNCTVLKVGHHGARTATSEEFLDKIRPSHAVISVGQDNRYGHPHPSVVKRLEAKSISISRTDRHGAIVFYSDGVSLNIDHFIKSNLINGEGGRS